MQLISLSSSVWREHKHQTGRRLAAAESWLQQLMDGAETLLTGWTSWNRLPRLSFMTEYRWMETELQFEDVSLRLIFHIKVISVLNISHLLHIVLFSRLLSHFVRGVTWRPLYVWLCVTVVASDPCYITQLTHRTRLKSHWSINRTSIRSAVWRMTQSFTSCALFWYFWHHSRWLITAFTWKYCRIVSI